MNFHVSELMDSVKGLTSLTNEATLSLSERIVFYENVLHKIYSDLVKAIPVKAWPGPEGSRRLRLPDFMTVGT
jgi:hypothetical protein